MPLPLPDLDTRAFSDLADEARASIPRYAPVWTDHNLSDPGITVTELVAAQLDQLLYAVNRITDHDRRTLLRLLGFAPQPPSPARTVVAATLQGAAPAVLPAGLVLDGRSAGGAAVPFRLARPVPVGATALVAVQVQDGTAYVDVTRAVAEEEPFLALGRDPGSAREVALLLGLDPLPFAGDELALWLAVDGGSDPDRIALELGDPARLTHHDARVVWEVFDGAAWQEIPNVEDATRALTVSGTVRFQLPVPPVRAHFGAVGQSLGWIRVRLAAGSLDEAPRLEGIALHAAEAVQAIGVTRRYLLAKNCVVPAGGDPVPGTPQPLALELDAQAKVVRLTAAPTGADLPHVEVLDYNAATPATEGTLLCRAVRVGPGERAPAQIVVLPGGPVVASSVAAWVVRGLAAEAVRIVDSLDASLPHSLHAVLDPTTGGLRFGDGRRGRMLPENEVVFASYEVTEAAAGNLHAPATFRIAGADDDANRVRLGGAAPNAVDAAVACTAPWPASGGADGEDVVRAVGRAARDLRVHERLLNLVAGTGESTLDGCDPAAVQALDVPERALNGLDLERIVLDVPGCGILRARAWPEFDPTIPGLRAAGSATVVVLPGLPAARPEASAGVLEALRQVVERRRLVGSRILVAPTTYVEVYVRARLGAVVGRDPTAVAAAARAAVDDYLHPLTGGPARRGWPFGRDLYRPEILAVLDGAEGVDYVAELELFGPDGETCGSVCVPPNALLATLQHDIEVVS